MKRNFTCFYIVYICSNVDVWISPNCQSKGFLLLDMYMCVYHLSISHMCIDCVCLSSDTELSQYLLQLCQVRTCWCCVYIYHSDGYYDCTCRRSSMRATWIVPWHTFCSPELGKIKESVTICFGISSQNWTTPRSLSGLVSYWRPTWEAAQATSLNYRSRFVWLLYFNLSVALYRPLPFFSSMFKCWRIWYM